MTSSATPAPAGVLIALEGGDGAGKSSQVQLLAQALQAAGREVVVTRQPGATGLGRAVRELVLHGAAMTPRAEALLYAADKAQHVEEVVRPALSRGAVVITDRYTDSSIAYQGAGRDLDAGQIRQLQHWAVDDVLPEVTIVLDIPAALGRSRRGDVHDRLEAEGDDFHERVRSHFIDLAAADPQRYVVIDAAGSVEQIHEAIVAALTARGLL